MKVDWAWVDTGEAPQGMPRDDFVSLDSRWVFQVPPPPEPSPSPLEPEQERLLNPGWVVSLFSVEQSGCDIEDWKSNALENTRTEQVWDSIDILKD